QKFGVGRNTADHSWSCGRRRPSNQAWSTHRGPNKEEPMHRVRMFIVAALLLPIAAAGQSQPRRIVIRASTVLDGKGGVLRDVGLVIEGTKIVRIDSSPSKATYDLRGLTVMPGWI